MNPVVYQLKQIDKFLSGMGVEYAVVGGIAVSIYGEPRLTMDIDVNVMLESGKVADFLKKAKKYGFSPVPSRIKNFIRKTGVIPMKFSKSRNEGLCDFIIAQNPLERAAIRRARLKKISSVNVKIARAEDIVIHKILSDRPRDLEDAGSILIKQRKKLDTKYILFWLKKVAEANRKPELIPAFKNLLKTHRIV